MDSLRMVAATAVVLLLWCHALDPSLLAGHSAPAPHAAPPAQTMLAAPAPPPAVPFQVSCCYGGVGSNLLTVSLSQLPTLAIPLLAAVLSLLLALPLLRPARGAARSLAHHRAGLVQQAVLIRI